jgi:hypothetical protein
METKIAAKFPSIDEDLKRDVEKIIANETGWERVKNLFTYK